MLLESFARFEPDAELNEMLSGTLRFNAQHPIFQGHFPGNPIVPGACLLQLLREIAERQLKRRLQFMDATGIKFLELLRPDSAPELEATLVRRSSNLSIRATFRLDRAVCAQMEAHYKVLD